MLFTTEKSLSAFYRKSTGILAIKANQRVAGKIPQALVKLGKLVLGNLMKQLNWSHQSHGDITIREAVEGSHRVEERIGARQLVEVDVRDGVQFHCANRVTGFRKRSRAFLADPKLFPSPDQAVTSLEAFSARRA